MGVGCFFLEAKFHMYIYMHIYHMYIHLYTQYIYIICYSESAELDIPRNL